MTTTKSGLTPWLQDAVRSGDAILFLGAGATFGASGLNGERPLTGPELRDLLADRFLGGAMKDHPLAQVAELAKSESSLFDVQRVIRDAFDPLQPAPFHLLIPSFRWFAIVTTNYDRVVERAYDTITSRLQRLEPILREGDRILNVLRDQSALPYLKLHGCVTHISDAALPLILGSEEYAKYRDNRGRLFDYLKDWGREKPIIFCGYDISDPNIQQILFDLADKQVSRPRYALVRPALTEYEIRYWQQHNFVTIPSTFENFLRGLDDDIPAATRQLSLLRNRSTTSIQKWIAKGEPSDQLLMYLDAVLEHVHEGVSTQNVSPRDFYRGEGAGWAPIVQSLDLRRRIANELEIEAILDKPPAPIPRAYLVKGHAGSGKSIVLKRLAWAAATEHNALVFWLRDGGFLRDDLIHELYTLTQERIVIAIDDALRQSQETVHLLEYAARNALPITLLLAARSNEWNVSGEALDQHVDKSFELTELSDHEIDGLLKLLAKHNCDTELRKLDVKAQRDFFQLSAERQLLVALHEAISGGKPFEEIVLDEYDRLVPPEAKSLYLDVATLHKFKVGVRAGLISRVSGITLDSFRDRLLRPLEHVVSVYMDPSSRDYAYRTRHPVIADILFRTALASPAQRSDQLVRIISRMNVDYESDHIAFAELIRGRDLAELFADRGYADRVFVAALEARASIAHIEHQRAIFELNHHAGSVVAAQEAIQRAIADVDTPSDALLHTKAMVLRKLALESGSAIERDRRRAEAQEILRKQIRRGNNPHAFHTEGEILLDQLSDRVRGIGQEERVSDQVVSSLISEVEEVVESGLQRFPMEPYLHQLEARLANFLSDTPRAVNALEAAFASSPGKGYAAVRLSEVYFRQGSSDRAQEVLMKCLEENPTSRPAHLQLAKCLIRLDSEGNREAISRHLRSSFTDGDSNYEAQYWFARHEFLFGRREVGLEGFRKLSKAKVSPEARNLVAGQIRNANGELVVFEGTIVGVQEFYCFVRVPDINTDVFVHSMEFGVEQWQHVRRYERVKLSVGFSFRGPAGFRASIQGKT
jgi:tetratricopeptide (TPR) repeat protein